ncbi:MAG: hypothetical protein MK193_13490 [Lentisphaeria bacterium]|nr:hypothetical protein [Lentisphaeria bacterium]
MSQQVFLYTSKSLSINTLLLFQQHFPTISIASNQEETLTIPSRSDYLYVFLPIDILKHERHKKELLEFQNNSPNVILYLLITKETTDELATLLQEGFNHFIELNQDEAKLHKILQKLSCNLEQTQIKLNQIQTDKQVNCNLIFKMEERTVLDAIPGFIEFFGFNSLAQMQANDFNIMDYIKPDKNAVITATQFEDFLLRGIRPNLSNQFVALKCPNREEVNYFDFISYTLPGGKRIFFLNDLSSLIYTESKNRELLGQIQTLKADNAELIKLIPICATCRQQREDLEYTTNLENYLFKHGSDIKRFSACPDCKTESFQDYEEIFNQVKN